MLNNTSLWSRTPLFSELTSTLCTSTLFRCYHYHYYDSVHGLWGLQWRRSFIQKQFKIYTCKYKCTPTKYKCTQIHMVARKKGKLSSSPTPLLPIGFSDSPLLLSHLRLSPKLVKTAPEKDPRKISHSDIPPTELSNNFHLLKCLQNFSANLDLQVYLI